MFLTICSILAVSSLLTAVEYEINDIGMLQTKASEAIAINNKGQILGWYNIDGSNEGKHFFVRDRDGSFREIAEDFSLIFENVPYPQLQEYVRNGLIRIDWKYLTDDGRVYGVINPPMGFEGPFLSSMFNSMSALFMWDQHNGVVKLGDLPGKEIMAINNAGQVLIKSVIDNENGKSVKRPVIWENGQITKLCGLAGDIGIESEESYGLDMNNKGEVVGQSLVFLSFKNALYTQVHATKWVNGQAIDLHDEVPKAPNSYALAINDYGDVLVGSHLIRNDGTINMHNGALKMTDKNYLFKGFSILDRNGNKVSEISGIGDIFHYDKNSIWWAFEGIIGLNDSGEIISQGRTVWGEQHAMLLTPIKPE